MAAQISKNVQCISNPVAETSHFVVPAAAAAAAAAADDDDDDDNDDDDDAWRGVMLSGKVL